jgi:chromosome segregation ATPase
MKFAFFAGLTAVSASSPIDKIITMIGDLEQKIIKEGEDAHKVYAEFAEWCEDTSKDVMYEIKTGKGNVADLKATIEKESANIDVQDSAIEDLAGQIATNEADLKAATEIRDKEESAFASEEKDLAETTDTLERAIGIIEKEMNGGASFAQIQKASTVVQVLAVMVQAQSISVADGKKLASLAQVGSADEDAGAPDPAVYENQSGGVMDTMNKLLEEAQAQLDAARNKETASIQAFEMLKQGLEDEIKFGNKEMDEAKQSKSASSEAKATAEGDLDVTSKDLAEDIKTLSELHHNCMTKANDFEAETKSRGEELKALATAKKIIKETTGGAADQSYGFDQTSFLQMPGESKAVRFISQLAQHSKSPALAQLASRMASTIRFSTGSQADIFAKVKDLIRDMIEKLEAEAEADATKKAYCDKELAETNQKKDDKNAEIEKLGAKIESSKAKSAKLKEEVATLQKELAALVREQAEMDKIRAEEKAAFDVNSAEMEKGLNGIKMALKVLNEYYAKADKAHDSSDGASSGIIGLLEVCESDFSKGLAEMKASEESAIGAYEQETKENEIEKVTKTQDAKYKTKESAGLDKSVAELSSDKDGVETELAAVMEYLKKIEEECIAKPETYEERTSRREAEIAGLKEAQTILNEESALIQTSHSVLRGAKRHF